MKHYHLIKLVRKPLKTLVPIFKGFFKWIVLGLVIGGAVGVIASLFHLSLAAATDIRVRYPVIIWLLPVGGLLVALIYKCLHLEHDKGTNMVLVAVRDGKDLTLRNTLSIFLGSVITHLFGGSAGREGAALQIGGSIGSQAGLWLKLGNQDHRLITMCGMSAGFAALFGTPAAAALFAMEVISVGIMHYSAIVPCSVAAVTGCRISALVGSGPENFKVTLPEMSAVVLVKSAVIAVAAALLSIFFCFVLRNAAGLYKRYIRNPYLRAAAGGGAVAILTFICGTQDYNGGGMEVIVRAFDVQAPPWQFALKLLFTALTLGAGFKGGEILPAFFTGASFGSFAAPLLGLDCSVGAAIGLAAVFCGITNCPVTAFILSIELFGAEYIPIYMLTCAISYMLSGYAGLYSEQKILYSKLEPKYIDKKIGR